MRSCGVASLGLGLSVTRRVSSRGFSSVALLRARFSVLYLDTLSARDVGPISMPHGFAYCKSPSGQRVSPPAGQYSFLVLCQSSPRPFPHRLVSAGPHALAATCPLGHSPVFPHPNERHFYFVDSFIGHNSVRQRSDEINRFHFDWLHLQWLANCSYPNGRRLLPSLHYLPIPVHRFN